MTTKKTATKKTEDHSIPVINEDSDTEDVIQINNNVVADIVRQATLQVPGVHSVGSSFVGNLTEIFKRREVEAGLSIDTNEADEYMIKIRVYMLLGVELTQIAREVQTAIRNQVSLMTEKKVAKVDVIIEGVRASDKEEEDEDSWEEEQS